MTCRPRPEAEEPPQRCTTSHRVSAIARWLQHAEEALLSAPDAPDKASAPSLEARYSLHWGGGSMGILAILRFPVDARHPVAQKPSGAYAVGDVFPCTYQGRPYDGRVIERHVSRAEGLVELHVQAAGGEEQAPSSAPAHAESDGVHGGYALESCANICLSSWASRPRPKRI